MIALARGALDVLLAALWQDACIALVVGTVLALAGRRINAATRFVALHALLFTLIAVPVATTLPHASGHEAMRVLTVATSSEPERLPDLGASAPALGVVDVASSDVVVAAVTALWLLVLAAFVLRYAAGALRLSRLLHRSTRLGRRDGVPIFASPEVPVPLACGFVRPSIVVPAEVIARGGEELECVVLHELAHVRRRDAWTNAYERVVHAVLFCNPAVVLVLRAIAFEREAACDDWAVARLRDLDAYARSLASFALRRHERASAVYGVSGFGSATIARLRRLEDAHHNGAPTLGRAALGGFTAMLVLVALAIGTFAPTLALASDQVAVTTPASDPCPKMVPGPRPLAASVPEGLRTTVDVRVSHSGVVSDPVIVRSSGNAGYDRITSNGARQFLLAIGRTIPPSCDAPLPGLYHISVESRGLDAKRHVRESLWIVKADWMHKPVVLPGSGRG